MFMKITLKGPGQRIRYAAPDCELLDATPGELLCESAGTEDWVYDDGNDLVI